MTAAAPDRVNLLGLPRPQLEEFFASMGEKPFRARQVMKWIYKQGVGDFEQMTDLSKPLRERLNEVAQIAVPRIALTQVSADGTRKWMLEVQDASEGTAALQIEMVYIPEPDRGTLCISSQVGCALDCTFCSTAQQGFNRNLTAAEIVGQVWLANRELGWNAGEHRPVTNVVFMGMGEPLANYRNVLPAMQLMLDDFGFDLSRRRVTLSTSGLAPQILRLAQDCNVALAVSLHAPNDELRNQLVPINRKHPIAELLAACWLYLEKQNGRSITFEYVMLDGVNDSEEHARQLIGLLRGREAKVNLIPFNSFPHTQYRRSPAHTISRFRDLLNAGGVIATTRRTRGDDIDAACGQLVGRVRDRTTVRLGRKLIGVTVEA
ncbi:MAG: 23S rRNA (adenine(2503)-C(2))-methyltransferase RlmN [Gammaproteobacteria bacterium]|nr:23S rRNA (adenine(2503)-C(2))-methyltransferase RlmN [Gammaproteobacteria bacterium]